MDVHVERHLGVLNDIMSNVENKQQRRKRNEFDEDLQEIQGRIFSHLESYEEDRKNFDKQIAKKVQASTKFVNIDELQKIITDSEHREAHAKQIQGFIVVYKNKSMERLSVLTDVCEALDIAGYEVDHGGNPNFDVESEIESTIQDVSGAIIKLDEISSDILEIIGNTREGAAAKKRRQLERKFNSMKTDMEKLNIKLLEAKEEIGHREVRCNELQALIAVRDEKIIQQQEEVERFKDISLSMTDDRAKERKERIDTIFMYEERIKELEAEVLAIELKKKIPLAKTLDEKETQTIEEITTVGDDESTASEDGKEDVDAEDADDVNKESLKFETLFTDNSSLQRPTSADGIMLPLLVRPKTPDLDRIHSSNTKSCAAQTDEYDEHVEKMSPQTSGMKIIESAQSVKSTSTSENSLKPLVTPGPSPEPQDKENIILLPREPSLTHDEPVLIQSHPLSLSPSVINTTKALVRCYNKLLWFGAEVEDLINVKIIENVQRFDDQLLSLSHHELDQAITNINSSVDDLLVRISSAIQDLVNSKTKNVELLKALNEKYKKLVEEYQNVLAEIEIQKKSRSPKLRSEFDKMWNLHQSTEPAHLKTANVRSKSSVEITGLPPLRIPNEYNIRIPTNISPRSQYEVKKENVSESFPVKPVQKYDAPNRGQYFQDRTCSPIQIHENNLSAFGPITRRFSAATQQEPEAGKPELDAFDTVTSESFSICGSYAENRILLKINSYHDQLTEHLIKDKELSVVHDTEDEKTDGEEGSESTEATKHVYTPPTIIQINDFARDWARSIKSSEYKADIVRGLTELGIIENRRDKLMSSFERTLHRLRQSVRYKIRRATRDMRMKIFKKFEPELHMLYIIGKGKYATPERVQQGYKVGRIRSPGKLRDRCRRRDSAIEDKYPLTLSGAGCQLNKLKVTNVNNKNLLPDIVPKIFETSTYHVPRLLEMDLNRQTIGMHPF